MMDDCTVVCSLWDGSPGGTSNCVEYAERGGRQRINIDPRKGLSFIEKKERAMVERCNREGGWYLYLGSLRWQFKPTVKVRSPVLLDDSEIPF